MYGENRLESKIVVDRSMNVVAIKFYDRETGKELTKQEYDSAWEEIMIRRMAEAMQRPIGLSV